MQETWVRSLGWEDNLEKGKATHSSTLAWRIPWTVWSMGSQSDTTEQLSLHFTYLLTPFIHAFYPPPPTNYHQWPQKGKMVQGTGEDRVHGDSGVGVLG